MADHAARIAQLEAENAALRREVGRLGPALAEALEPVLKARGHESYRLHRTVARPWGAYTVLQEGPCFKIKRIEVKAGAALSLQLHRRRSEHWVVVSGTAKVMRDDEVF